MPVFQNGSQFPANGRISVMDAEQFGTGISVYNKSFGIGIGGIGTNVATYIPFVIPTTVTVYRLWTMYQGTALGNYDLGLYTETGTRLASIGSTAVVNPHNYTLLYGDIPDTIIARGTYYVALAYSNGSAGCCRFALSAGLQRGLGLYVQSSALPLPATATFSTSNTTTAIPLVGLDLRGY